MSVLSTDAVRDDRVLTLHKNGSCEITQLLSRPKVSKSHCVIEQEPFCGVRTHFYHDASSYGMFRDRRVVEVCHVLSQLFPIEFKRRGRNLGAVAGISSVR